MESNFLVNIQPINTKEKVHAVVQAYKKGKFRSLSTSQFIIDVSLLIRKVNLQILFKEEMAGLFMKEVVQGQILLPSLWIKVCSSFFRRKLRNFWGISVSIEILYRIDRQPFSGG